MFGEGVLHTKLNPPQPQHHTLVRPRVLALLRDALDHRLTIVHASTGYGKSTALAQFADSSQILIWYSVSEGDSDPNQFLRHVIAAFHLRLPTLPETPLVLLEEAGAQAALDALLNALSDHCTTPSLLVIDDYYLAASDEVNALVDHFLTFVPPHLHVIVSTRYPLPWPSLTGWRALGQVLDIKRDALAFTRDESAALFQETYHLGLSPEDIDILMEKTEGWPIALQLVWQEMRANPKVTLNALFSHGSAASSDRRGALDTLFAYLTHGVLAQQPQPLQDFVLQTSVLRQLDAAACNAVARREDSRELLAELHRRDLFVIALRDGQYRYHHLFHDFLREQALQHDPEGVRERHRRAAKYFRRARNYDEAVYHLLHGGTFAEAAALIQDIGESVLRVGRLDTLAMWIDMLPPEEIAAHPLIMFYLGDLARLRSRFNDALGWYHQAEGAWRDAKDTGGITRALRGQALVYLDTLRPAQAEKALQEALRLTDRLDDRATKARLLEMLAESKLTIGKVEKAERLRAQARALREEGPSEDALSIRVKIRTGRLEEARAILETWAHDEGSQLHIPRGHRETLLILSLIYAFQGRPDDALSAAQEAMLLGSRFHSPFISAVGQLRLGHAHQLRGDLPEAIRCYEEAAALGDQLAVPRTRAEARWGMTRAHGLAGDYEAAARDAAEGIKAALGSGDIWVAGLVQLALGGSHVLAQHDRRAIQVLDDAHAAFRSSGDSFACAATREWLALACWHMNQREHALTHLDDALAKAETLHYDYLFTQRTLLGVQDNRVLVPLLLEMRSHAKHVVYINRLLAAMGLSQVSSHPGYQLRIQTFGAFRVWRGDREVTEHEWQRRKARQLLQLLVNYRGRMLQREEVLELLWNKESTETAARDFRVTLNALNRALEPNRFSDDAPAFISREGGTCGLRPGADIWIDADEFTQLIARADNTSGDAAFNQYCRALALYKEDYLTDTRYEDWTSTERERLLALYLRTADRVARDLFTRGDLDLCLAQCESILMRDRCWEHAYHLLMRIYAQRSDRVQVRRAFDRCANALRQEVDLEPSPATVELYHQLVG